MNALCAPVRLDTAPPRDGSWLVLVPIGDGLGNGRSPAALGPPHQGRMAAWIWDCATGSTW
jgi:hypothetical protein